MKVTKSAAEQGLESPPLWKTLTWSHRTERKPLPGGKGVAKAIAAEGQPRGVSDTGEGNAFEYQSRCAKR